MGVDESEQHDFCGAALDRKVEAQRLGEADQEIIAERDVFGERLRIHSAPGPIPATAEPDSRTLEKLGIPRSSFYRWCDRHQRGGPEALADRPSRPDRVWNRIPEAIRSQIVDLALDQPELSPRELAVRFTDAAEYFVSEASVYRLLKAHDLIASPAYIVIKAAEEFKDKTTAPTSSGRPTSPISRSRAGAGAISPLCWTTSRASLSPGSSARR